MADDMGGITYSTLKAHSPCYDVKSDSDCPKRKVGCRACCPEWQAYVKACKKEMKIKHVKIAEYNDYMGYVSDRARKIRGKK